jgi:hypothetical protein
MSSPNNAEWNAVACQLCVLVEFLYVVTVIRTIEMFEMINRPRAVEKNRLVNSL